MKIFVLGQYIGHKVVFPYSLTITLGHLRENQCGGGGGNMFTQNEFQMVNGSRGHGSKKKKLYKKRFCLIVTKKPQT